MAAAGPRYTPTELLALARRAEADGQLQYAVRLYNFLAVDESAPSEAYEARRALDRLTPHPSPPPPHNTAHQAPAAAFQPQQAPNSPEASPPMGQLAGGPPPSVPPWAGAPTPAPMRETTGPPPYGEPAMRRPPEAGPPSQWDLGRQAAGAPANAVSRGDEGGRAALPRVVRPEASDDIDEALAVAVPSYRTGRSVAALVTILGWLGFGLAIAMAGATILGSVRTLTSPDPATGLPYGFLAAAGAMAFSAAALLVGQITRAVFDIAASNRELAEIERLRSGW
ncbi:MAG: hypothetical protein NW217_05750 [Hyphomicrobiaceae bacterium]|nr:hypothetical protein [Hyphomicrobiaceae bacterium]